MGGKKAAIQQLRDAKQQLQYVWVSCEGQAAQDDVFMLCEKSRQSLLRPKVVKPDVEKCQRWHQLMLLQRVPKPYASKYDKNFMDDMDAWLTAAYEDANVHDEGSESFCRWPSVLVTDSPTLVKASADLALRTAVAGTIGIELVSLLPVVLCSDFGHVTGLVKMEAPLAVCEPWCWRARCRCLPDRCNRERAAYDVSVDYTARQVEVKDGVYWQKKCPETKTLPPWPKVYGSRCLALFSDGRCAYSAVSADGSQVMETSGTWEVINGHVVVIGNVYSFSLCQGNEEFLKSEAYDEPLHIPLEELESDFEPPVSVEECLKMAEDTTQLHDMAKSLIDSGCLQIEMCPRPVDDLRSKMLRLQALKPTSGLKHSAPEVTPRPWQQPGELPSYWAKRQTPQAKLWDMSQALPMTPPSIASVTPSRPASVAGGRTNVTRSLSLTTLTSLESRKPLAGPGLMMMSKSSSVRGFALQAEPTKPRMLGGLRAIRFSKSANMDPAEFGSLEDTQTKMALHLLRDYASKAKAVNQPLSFPTCPLRPGTYLWENGQPGSADYNTVSIVLHAGGGCSYREYVKGNITDTVPGMGSSTSWSVKDGKLVLDTCQAGSHCFWRRVIHGTRFKQWKVASIELPVAFLQQDCTFTPFSQVGCPFPGLYEVAEKDKVLGVIDPHSNVLRKLQNTPRKDMITVSAFERELRAAGLGIDEIISDFHFIDRNEDGTIPLEKFQDLESDLTEKVSLEVIHNLRAALLTRFHSLDRAFQEMDHMTEGEHCGQVSLRDFKAFISGAAALESAFPKLMKLGRADELEEWLARHDETVLDGIFQLAVGRRKVTMSLENFRSLSLHSGMLAVCRLEHFQSWAYSEFGTSCEGLKSIFVQEDKKDKKKKHPKEDAAEPDVLLLPDDFIKKVQDLGYACSDQVCRSVFALLDSNFSGDLSFHQLSDTLTRFSSEKVVNDFVGLKTHVIDKFGSLDSCWEAMVAEEKLQTKSLIDPREVSYQVFHQVMHASGVMEAIPEIDMNLLLLIWDESTEKHPDGYLNHNEWMLLQAFEASALDGSAARLCNLLNSTYGSLEAAYASVRDTMQKRMLLQSLQQTAIRSLARSFACGATGPIPIGSVPIQPNNRKTHAWNKPLNNLSELSWKGGATINPGALDIDKNVNSHHRYFVSTALEDWCA